MSFFFNDTATTEIYTLSLHDALPISYSAVRKMPAPGPMPRSLSGCTRALRLASCSKFSDRKSTRLNSSHANISYAVFCLKKKSDRRGRQTRKPIRNHIGEPVDDSVDE